MRPMNLTLSKTNESILLCLYLNISANNLVLSSWRPVVQIACTSTKFTPAVHYFLQGYKYNRSIYRLPVQVPSSLQLYTTSFKVISTIDLCTDYLYKYQVHSSCTLLPSRL
jgi:hypothetical protein